MIFAQTESVCPVCLRRLPAQLRSEKDGVYMDKSCPDHGAFSALIWEDNVRSYLRWSTENTAREAPKNGKEPDRGCPYDCGLCREHRTKGCCVLLELTNRCNLHCPVCFASAGEHSPSDLSIEEIGRQYDYLMAHGGPFNIQLSGGEPTMRDDLPQIIRLGRQKGFIFFQLNTNGLRLAEKPDYAFSLKEAGLNTVFLQFDGVSDSVYETLRGRPLLQEKERAIVNCAAAGLGIVLVPVIAAGVNDSQVGAILRYALGHMPAVRGVHFQPLSYFGRCALPRPEKPVTIPRMLRLMEEQSDGLFHAADFSGGGAENPYCSFHASYIRRSDGSLKPLRRKSNSGCCCVTSDDSRQAVAAQWSGETEEFAADGELQETSALDAFLEQTRLSTLVVSGMVFQDAWNLDLNRLRRCYICEMDSEKGMVPFCAYNLTDIEGRALYRK
ncbi:MAG: radical SAM protein [Oscillospiraceae bacterium]|nr:radical SAM protein [Oscillospiraceae bacterium]